ncbi:50S ribosomal protein L25/general stress protein Ctc [Corynebacterium bovis]|uniref:Large ribosomal subunit protein bL25 n=2 Tax=Corynebacterium bovis TaxID=36808 RepID=A0A3R8PM27_9CORY|nr:50S ribosomal protein L25/general stress protein Ctc [Corynebacterium bovis]MBB3115779.1 large subunit ribosomal protein L25 [Corynebacterium bovis DSM 20582 = CIP 54.80]MDK8510498.1 50S ribosomal protein L25/general stress protein Ctc [Corynebacterium bovis]MDN8578637.1 50S ribosomal protein L25/general stress protein Ctc [Corynebacterium bovis]QQC47452.1 50S ribosomal protein L25/general stress protein Ctc [Corynebacterium bovis]RRO87277.1 50S ribosomal protein L25 [Corynebacterium bovis]
MAHDITVLQAQPRTEFGKGAARRLRRDFRIPAVIYGSFHEPIHVSLNILEFHSILRHQGANAVVEVEVEGEKHLAMIKAVDQNVLTMDVDHADLLSVKRGEKVEVDVPVVTTGEAAPGALVTQDADVVTVEADVLNIPEEIVVSIEGKEIGDQIVASDLQMPGNCTLVSDPETLIVNIVEPQEEELPEDTEEALGEDGEVESAPADPEEPEATEAPESDES